ncbi:MAG: DMT family transporter [Acidimicrobiales bacterium]
MRTGVARCLVAAALFGASAPAAATLAGGMSPLVLAGLLYLGAGLAVLPRVVSQPPDRLALQRDAGPAVVAVIAGGAVGPALLMAGLARTSAANASILLNLELAATVALAATVFREHLGRRLLIGAGMVVLAGAVLVWEPGAALDTGALFVAAACAAWGIDNGVTARIDQLSPEHVVALKGFGAGAVNLLLGLVIAEVDVGLGVGSALAAVAIGALGYGVSIVLWVKGARDLGAARGQVIFAAAPFIGAVVAWTVLGEPVAVIQLVAVALAVVGVAVSLESSHEHQHTHTPVEHEHEHEHEHSHGEGHHDHHDLAAPGIHAHRHHHQAVTHAHPHVPDLHHRHH